MYIDNSACQWPTGFDFNISETTSDKKTKMSVKRNFGPREAGQKNKDPTYGDKGKKAGL